MEKSERIRRQNEINMTEKIRKLTKSNLQLRTVANVLLQEKDEYKHKNIILVRELDDIKDSKKSLNNE